jgi:hypothetical protein
VLYKFQVEIEACRAAVDDAADSDAMRFAESCDPKKCTESIHAWVFGVSCLVFGSSIRFISQKQPGNTAKKAKEAFFSKKESSLKTSDDPKEEPRCNADFADEWRIYADLITNEEIFHSLQSNPRKSAIHPRNPCFTAAAQISFRTIPRAPFYGCRYRNS